MTVEAITAITALPAEPPLAPLAATAPADGFGGWFASELDSVNGSLVRADKDVQKLAVDEAANLHEVMIHLEEARLSFQLLAQVRNKLLDAYQEVMRMQV